MNIVILQEIQASLISSLSDPEFLERVSLNEEDILPHIKDPAFLDELSILFEDYHFTCSELLDFCKLTFNHLFFKTPSDGWMTYAYEYTLFQSFPHLGRRDWSFEFDTATLIYLSFMGIIYKYEKLALSDSQKDSYYSLEFLEDYEMDYLINPTEYQRFISTFRTLYVYEMMRLHQEITHHNTHDHICGVHSVALHVARQLYEKGIPVDLGRVSGAAAGHDIGKYGCTGDEVKRIPYLHYYYSDLWFNENGVPHIGHVAVNHSTWDLELETLSLESLVLIYADFRVKNDTSNGKKIMKVFSLANSFDVILKKLDNVDETKANRYKKVYAKLVDFENYMINLGIYVVFGSDEMVLADSKDKVLMHGQEVVESLKYKAIEHNNYLLFKLRNETTLSSMIETARRRSNWKMLRSYLNIFEEYSTYFTPKQKLITINYLYELLFHYEEDIRRRAAQSIGRIIASFDEEYRKEMPDNSYVETPEINSLSLFEKYLNLIIHPDHKMVENHKEWLQHSLRVLIESVFHRCTEKFVVNYREIFLSFLANFKEEDDATKLHMLQSIKFIPWHNCDQATADSLSQLLFTALGCKNSDIRLITLDRIEMLMDLIDVPSFNAKFTPILCKCSDDSVNIAEKFIKCRIANKMNLCNMSSDWYDDCFTNVYGNISDIYLKNLKSDTSWISVKFHIQMMLHHARHASNGERLYTAMHFSNLIKVSSKENVRINAGDALLKIIHHLSPEQRNDIAIELFRSLEIDSFEHGTHIPQYLGQIMMSLNPSELDELIQDFYAQIKSVSSQTILLILNTIGHAIEYYPAYRVTHEETDAIFTARLRRMLGIILIGFSNYEDDIRQEAFTVIGSVFASDHLTLKEKEHIFGILSKKILSMLPDRQANEVLFINNSASLNHIYRFISDYTHLYGDIQIPTPEKIAFFPGTFDPFSLTHKKIAKDIRDMGFEVFLSVDEFSWSKSTQPHLQRQKIVSMSIADEMDIYIFPETVPVNISNSTNLQMLQSLFEDKNIYIVVGKDVITNASSYKVDITPYSIHNFSHVIFDRTHPDTLKINHADIYAENLSKITGEIVELHLPEYYEYISSTLIRKSIDSNRDISNLVDPLAQKYIYEFGLYLSSPQYKTLVENHSMMFRLYHKAPKQLLQSIANAHFDNPKVAYQSLCRLMEDKYAELLVLYNTSNGKEEVAGFATLHWVTSSSLFQEFKDHDVSDHIRVHSIGRIVILDGLFTNDLAPKNATQMLLSEAISHALTKDYTYAVYKSTFGEPTRKICQILENQGFRSVENGVDAVIYDVDISRPMLLTLDILTFLKAPYRHSRKVIRTVQIARARLQQALKSIFPGSLVLSYEMEPMYQRLIDKICSTNNMPSIPIEPKSLGDFMCIPFGQILNGYVVPNTITKSLHSEKVFKPDLSDFSVEAYPQYLDLSDQVKMVKSFNHHVILVDDLLHKGYRIKAIDPLFKEADIHVEKIIVGILSSKGKELMDIQNRPVECAYFVPHLRNWFSEAALYPFIGGDSVGRSTTSMDNLLPSINLILPYVSPHFIKGASTHAIMNLSRVCIENSISILKVLEKEYQSIHEKSLTMKHLGEVFAFPRYPDKGVGIHYDYNSRASEHLQHDLEHLTRIERGGL